MKSWPRLEKRLKLKLTEKAEFKFNGNRLCITKYFLNITKKVVKKAEVTVTAYLPSTDYSCECHVSEEYHS
jgi:hypothetical protein